MIKNYIKIAWRNLVKGKLYTGINITGLGLGIASVLLIFLYIQHELSFDEYHEKKERIYRITAYSGFNEKEWQSYSSGDPVGEMRSNFAGVDDAVRMTRCSGGPISVDDDDFTDIDIQCTESNLFNIFSFPLMAGNKGNVLDAPFTAVISQSTARTVFGDQNPIGKSITFHWDDGKRDFEVTGVMKDIPVNSHFRYDVFLSYKSLESTNRCLDCGMLMYTLLEQNADTAAIADQVIHHIREIDGKQYVDDIRLQPLDEIHFSSLSAQRKGDWEYIQILSAIALVILVIGCGNYMNLATARYSRRSQEVGIRKAVGAHRTQLVRQFLLETLLLTLLTLPLALMLLQFAIPWFNLYADTQVSMALANNLWFYVGVTSVLVVTGLLAGSYPALYVSGYQPRHVLQGSHTMGFGSKFLQKGLVSFQFLASVVMIAVTALILQQLSFVQQKNLGFDSDQLVSIHINDPALSTKGETIKQEFLRQSSVEVVTASSAPATGRFSGVRFTFESDSIPDKKYTFITPRIDEDFLETMKINLVAGRNIRPTKNQDNDPKMEALINETGVKTLGFSSYDEVIDREISGRYRIVGVVEDFHLDHLKNEIEPALMAHSPFNNTYVVNARLAAGSISQGLEQLRTAWKNLEAASPLNYSFVDELIQQQYEQEQRTAWVIGVFAGLSIFIASMGLFGLVAFTTQQRSKEIGIRKVLGATLGNIVIMLSIEFLKLVGIGFVGAVPIAWYAMHRWLESFAYHIEIGPGIFLLAGGLTLVIALTTVSWQAVRAALANPVDSLRSE